MRDRSAGERSSKVPRAGARPRKEGTRDTGSLNAIASALKCASAKEADALPPYTLLLDTSAVHPPSQSRRTRRGQPQAVLQRLLAQ